MPSIFRVCDPSICCTKIDKRASVSRVMRRELFTMPEAGTLSDVGVL
jgi:hypothetical protein